MIANMAMSDLLYPIFLFPWFVAGMYMYVDSWPVSGRLGPILCKLSWFFSCFCRRFNSRPDSHSTQVNDQLTQMYLTIAIVVSNALCFTPIGIKNLLEIFTWIRYHPCKISVYVFQELSPFMAQAYCAINPWLCLIFSVKYRQGLNKFHCRQGSPKSELEER